MIDYRDIEADRCLPFSEFDDERAREENALAQLARYSLAGVLVGIGVVTLILAVIIQSVAMLKTGLVTWGAGMLIRPVTDEYDAAAGDARNNLDGRNGS